MENATKALLIAAAILIAILILSLIAIVYNQVSDYYTAEHEEKEIQQLKDVNEIFNNYNRDNIRGNDIISLMNRILDYNDRLSYEETKKYPRIIVSIHIGNDHINEFKFKRDTRSDATIFKKISSSGDITNKLNTAEDYNTNEYNTADDNLIWITKVEDKLIDDYPEFKLTSTKLQRLASDISNIVIDSQYETGDDNYSENIRFKRKNLLNNILRQNVAEYSTTEIEKIKEITCKYYEFTQFKRALFNCTELIYDQDSGRVKEMKFEVKIKNGNVVFN